MKLNDSAYDLHELFASILNISKSIWYCNYKKIDLNSHIRLEHDRDASYYAARVAELFISIPRHVTNTPFLNWQIRESYRLVNYALASSSPSILPLRGKLAALQARLEENDYLSTLLSRIDSGEIAADLVCSGHGVWFIEDGEIDLSNTNKDVAVYSGLGGALDDQLGVDIENEQYAPEKVVVKHGNLVTKEENKGFPVLFGNKALQKVPNFRLVDCSKAPHPRVIEPETGRVLFNLPVQGKRKFFSLLDVLRYFPERKVHWAGCTGMKSKDGPVPAPYSGFNWSKAEQPCSKKRKIESEPVEDIPTGAALI